MDVSVGTRVVSGSFLTQEVISASASVGGNWNGSGSENGTVGFVSGAKKRFRVEVGQGECVVG